MITARPTAFHLRYIRSPTGQCELIGEGITQRNRIAEKNDDGIFIKRHPKIIVEEQGESDHLHDGENQDMIVTIYSSKGKDDLAINLMMSECLGGIRKNLPITPEETRLADVYEIVKSGDPSNRIDVVLMGDAYTSSMLNEYLDDMTRMTNDMFTDITFSSFLPVFNIWGVFSASVDDQIGVNGQPENTRYRLYRDGTELRGVYCGSPNNARSDCTATGAFACDFPSLIGRDEYYGGLGGEFTISTRSLTSGTKVLRHEMGHNFASVGEEYEGGSAYFGANFASTLAVGWREWLTDDQYPPPGQQDDLVVQDYAWYDLGRGAYTIRITSEGTFARRTMRFTVSGFAEPDSLIVTLDGVRLNWETLGTMDRSFYEYYWPTGFTAGSHTLVFQAASPPGAGNPIRQLCSVTMQEYKAEGQGYTFDNSFMGAFPVRRSSGQQAGWRPNHEFCLMRNMTSRYFCQACQETTWMQFLAVMDWIDDVRVTAANSSHTTVTLDAVKVGQLREAPPMEGVTEFYEVSWFRNNVLQTALTDLFEFTLPNSSASGSWRVNVFFNTTEVRDDPNDLLTATQTFVI